MSFMPTGWTSGPLGRFMPLQRGFDLPTTKVMSGDVPVVYSNGIGRYHQTAMVDGPGVVTGRSGTIGRVHYVEGGYWPHNTTLWVTNFSRCDPKFAYYFLEAVRLERFAGGSGVPTLNRNDAHSFEVLLPRSLAEQRAIADALSSADNLIASLERSIAKKQAIKQGAMQQLLTARTRLTGFSGTWKPVRLRDAGSTYGGLTGKVKDDFGTGSAFYVTFMEVMVGARLYGRRLARVAVRPGERQNQVQRGDVLFNGSSETPEEVALAAVVDFDPAPLTFLNSFCFGYRLTATGVVDPAYMAYYFRSTGGRRLVASLAQGATRYNIAKTKLLNLAPILPPIAEQQAIAGVLCDFERDIAGLHRRLEKIRAVKVAMMQQLLTGRTRLAMEVAA